jgi:hypothetical protein
MQRSHPLSKDRDWLPTRVRMARMVTSVGIWTVGGVATVGSIVAAPWLLVLTKLWVFGVGGIAIAGDRAGHAMAQRRLKQMTRGELPLAELTARDEGELVVVRGTIEATETLQGIMIDSEGVYRRAEIQANGTWITEAAVDFSLVADDGARILIQAAGARWMVAGREKFSYPLARFFRDDVPLKIRERVAGMTKVQGYERVLPVGARVQIVGYKTASADATGTVTDYRSAPQRATLRSGENLPLVITLESDLKR